MRLRRVAVVPMLFGLLLLTGCSGPKKEAVYPVTGKVTVEGKPLVGCTIVFAPTGTGLTATSVILPDGSYKLLADGGRAGAPPGKYKIKLAPGQEMMQKLMTEQMAEAMKKGGPSGGRPGPPKFKMPYPESYGDAATSPKEVTVEAKDNVIDVAI